MAEVRPQVTGILRRRTFREGAEVSAGELLYEVDAAPYQAAYESAEAAVEKAEAALQLASVTATRVQRLVDDRALSAQELDNASATKRQAAAEVASAKAAFSTAKINLGYTHIRSPIAGRIGRSSITPGALVTEAQATPLTTVQQLDPIYVDFTQSSSALLRLRRELDNGTLATSGDGQAKVRLVLEDGTPYDHAGVLQFADVTVDESAGSVTLRAEFPNPKKELLPGMYVRVVLEEGSRQGAVLAPQAAVTRDQRGSAVAYVVTPSGVVEQRNLSTDRAIGDQWLVLDGLKAGDRLVVDGLQRVHPGDSVDTVVSGSKTAKADTTPTQVAD